MEYISGSEIETRDIAKIVMKDILKAQKTGPIFVGLVGDLGAGKTAFVKGVADFFGISERVVSPTFVIQKVYEIDDENRKNLGHELEKIIHIDMYRLEDERELSTISWDEYKSNTGNIIFVEWPNQVFSDYPKDMIEIKIEHADINTRKIIYGE